MGLINFIKNQLISYEEEIVEKEVEITPTIPKEEQIPINEPTKLPTILREELFNDNLKKELSDEEIFDSKTKFTFPIEEETMITQKQSKKDEVLVDEYNIPINTLIGNNYYETEKKFKPSQVISPIYGILDKNYRKEDITVKDECLYAVPRKKNLTYDDVRKKAYGTLTDEIELSLYEKSDEIKKTINNIDELLNNMNKKYENISPNLEEKSKQEEENDSSLLLDEFLQDDDQTFDMSTFNLDQNEDDNQEFLNNYNEESIPDDGQAFKNVEIVKIIDHNSNNIENIVNNNESSIDEVNDQLEEEDLFNLIDSMYEKGE